jgi:septum formation protein
VIGADQVACTADGILGKAGSLAAAAAQLRRLSGRSHRLITAVTVARGGALKSHRDVSVLRMRTLSDAEIERYLAADNPVDCAGSYKVEALGIALFDAIESADQTAIVGLPMLAVCELLRGFGLRLP